MFMTYKKFNTLLWTSMIALAFASCDKKKGNTFAPGEEAELNEGERTENLLEGAKERKKNEKKSSIYEETSVGVKDFSQLNKTMSSITGVNSANAAVSAVFRNVRASLAGENNFAQFSGAMQVSVVKLASEYCVVALNGNANNATIRNAFLGDIQDIWDLRLNAAFTPENRERIINHFAKKIWKHESNFAKEKELKAELNGLYDDLLQDRPDLAVETRRMIRATCTIFLSSSPVVVL